MHTYDCMIYNYYDHDTYILPQDVKCPKAPKKLGRRHRYNDMTIPPLDFRLYPKSPV